CFSVSSIIRATSSKGEESPVRPKSAQYLLAGAVGHLTWRMSFEKGLLMSEYPASATSSTTTTRLLRAHFGQACVPNRGCVTAARTIKPNAAPRSSRSALMHRLPPPDSPHRSSARCVDSYKTELLI